MKQTTGRTLYDLIADHSLTFMISGGILIIIIVLGFIFGNLSLKIWGLEINKKKCISDTIYVYRTDTIIIEKPVFLDKRPPKVNSKIELKKSDTSILVTNQPANINIGGTQNVVQENKGIVGNNNQIILSADNRKHLDKKSQIRLIELIDETIKSKNKNADCCIRISALMGNSDSFGLASEIVKFLKMNKYNIDDYVGQFMRTPGIKGVKIGFNNECIEIMVGYL